MAAASFARTIFDTLYTLLAFGHSSLAESALLDPPTSYFRVRLVTGTARQGMQHEACSMERELS